MIKLKEYILTNINEKLGDYYEYNKSKKGQLLWTDLALLGSYILGLFGGLATFSISKLNKTTENRKNENNGRYSAFDEDILARLERGDKEYLKTINLRTVSSDEFIKIVSISKDVNNSKTGYYKIEDLSDKIKNATPEKKNEKEFVIVTGDKKNPDGYLGLAIVLYAHVEYNKKRVPIFVIDLEDQLKNKEYIAEVTINKIYNLLNLPNNPTCICLLDNENNLDNKILSKMHLTKLEHENTKFIIYNKKTKTSEESVSIKDCFENYNLYMYNPPKKQQNKNNNNSNNNTNNTNNNN